MAQIRDLIIRSGLHPDTGDKTFIRIGDEKPATADNTASSIQFLGDLRDNNKSFDNIGTASAFRIRHDTINGALYIQSSTNSNKHTLIQFQDEGYVNIIAPTNFLATTTFDDITFDNIYGNNIFISTNSYISNSLIIGTGVNTSSFYYNNGYIIIQPNISSSGTIKAKQFTSSVAIGTPPFSIISNTLVNNLNSDLLDGTHSTGFLSINGGTLTDDLIIGKYTEPAVIRIGTSITRNVYTNSILQFTTNTNQSFDTANNSGSIRLRHDTNYNKLFFEAKNRADVISTPIVISYNTSSLSETNLNLGISLRPLNSVVDFNYNAVTNMVVWPNCYDVNPPRTPIRNVVLNSGDVLTGLLDQPGSYYTSLVGTGSITEIDIAVNGSGMNNGYGRTVGQTFSVGSATGTGKVIVDAIDGFGRVIALHIDPNNRGSGYSKTSYYCYSGSSITMRCQVIATGSGGSIQQVDLAYLTQLYGGTGYAVGDTLSIVSSSDYSGQGATVKVQYVDELGRCRYASLLESGSGYTTGKYNTVALTGTGSGCIVYIREISQSNRPPASGNVANIFRTPTSTYVTWTGVNDNNPVQLTVGINPTTYFGAARLFIVNGYRNQCPFKYKIEMITEYSSVDYAYSRRWYTQYEQTDPDTQKIKPYNKYIPIQVNTAQATRIRITVYQAGDSDFSQRWALQNLIGYQRYVGTGRFTGYMMSAFGDTAYGNYIINGYARLTSSTPTLNLTGGNSIINVTTNNSLTLRTNNTNRMTILNDGKVGINKTNPSVLLDVAGDVNLGSATSNIINVAGQLTSSVGISTSLVNASTGYTSSTGYVKVGGDIISNNNLSSPSFISGFNGSGWIISKSTIPNTRYTAVFDDLWIRGSMNVYELIINQIQSTNGSLWITDAGKATSASYNSSNKTLVLKFDSGSYIPFVPNDIIRTKRWGFSNSGANIVTSSIWDCITTISAINYAQGLVTLSAPETNNNYTYTSSANGTWTNFANNISISGSQWVRVGNVNTSSRQGAIYLTSTDLGGPFLDIYNSVSSSVQSANGNFNNVTESKLKLRLGNLQGLNLQPFGQMQGYGLYADNVYLRGTINATAGQIAGWTIQSNKLNNYSENNIIELTPTYLSFKNLMGYHLIVGYDTQYFNNFGVGFFYDLSPDNYYFKVDADGAFINGKIQANEGYIGGSNGWIIDTNKISSSYGIEFSNSTTPAIKIGATNYGNKGIWIGKGSDNNFSMSLYNDTNNYLKWNGQSLQIKTNNFTLSTAGNISASNAILGGTIYANSGQFSGSINALSGYIGGSNGWIIQTNKLRAQNNYIILQNDSSNPYISIGNVTAYNQNNGIWLGRDNNTNKISIRNSTGTQYILWDGTNLNILTPNFTLSNTSLTVKGTVSSTQGDIGGWNISNTQLKSNDNNFVLDSANKTITISANNALRIGHFNLPALQSVSVITNNLDLSQWDGSSYPNWYSQVIGWGSPQTGFGWLYARVFGGGVYGSVSWENPIIGSIRAGQTIEYTVRVAIKYRSYPQYNDNVVLTYYIKSGNTIISSKSYTEYQLALNQAFYNDFEHHQVKLQGSQTIYGNYSNLKFGFSWSGSSGIPEATYDLRFYGGSFCILDRSPEAYINQQGLHFQYGATNKYIRLSALESKLSNIYIDSELFKLGYKGQLRGSANSITLSLGSDNINSTQFIATDKDVYMSGSNFMISNGVLQGGTGGGGSGIAHSVVGTYLANLSNPSNYSYIKINTNGTVDYKTPSDVLSDIGAVPTSRTITATSPLTGGGTLSNNITIGHNNSAGSLHLPSGGSAGKFVIYGGSDGSGSWSTQTTNSFALSNHTHNPSDINSGLFIQNIGVDNDHTFSANNINVNRLMVNNYIAMFEQIGYGMSTIYTGYDNDSISASIGLINGNQNTLNSSVKSFLIVGDNNQIYSNSRFSVIQGTQNKILSNLTHINVKGKDAVAIISGSKVFADGNQQNFNNNFAFQTHQILLSGVCTSTNSSFIFKNDFYPDGVIYLNNLVYNSNATNSFAIYIDGILLEGHNYPYNFEQNFIVNLHDDIIVSSGMFGMSQYNNRSAGDFLSLDILNYGNGGIIIRGNNLLKQNLKVGIKIDILQLDTWS